MQAVRITDPKVLETPMTKVVGEVKPVSGVSGTGTVFAINHNADNALITLRYRLKDADIQMAEEPFEAAGQKFARGSFIIKGVAQADVDRTTTELGLKAYALAMAPTVKMHPARAARVAILHTWTSTQTEGWWRQAFDVYGMPFDYIDPGFVGKTTDLRAKYDVIVAGPGIGQNAVDGIAMYRNAEPWRNSPETPNIGTYAQTDDIRLGMQMEGLLNIRNFVQHGGVFVAATGSADFLITNNLAKGVTSARPGATTRVVGSLLRTTIADAGSPIMYGIPANLAVYSDRGETINAGGGGGGARRRWRRGGDRGGRGARRWRTDPSHGPRNARRSRRGAGTPGRRRERGPAAATG